MGGYYISLPIPGFIMMHRTIILLLLLFDFDIHLCFAQIISNPSFEGQIGESTPPPDWFSCNTYSTPDTQPGIWMVSKSASQGSTYISLVTRGRNKGVNDGYTEAVSTRLLENLQTNACYKFSLDLAYFSKFDDGITDRYGTWKPVKLKVWASNTQCDKMRLLWHSETVTNQEWQSNSFAFTVDQQYQYVILEADFSEPDIHNGNILIDNIQISKIQLQLNDAILCKGESATFQVDFPGATINWSTGDIGNNLEIKQPGNYWVTANDGTCTVTDTFKVSIPEQLKVDLGKTVTQCEGDSVILSVPMKNVKYLWNTGSTEASINVKEAGIYKVRVDNGCEYVEDEVEVVFAEQCCLISAPNIFTPNNDGLNDAFEISSGSNIGQYHLRIYNRWGGLVYESQKMNQYWKGNDENGKEASAGVYFWTIDILCIRNNQITHNTFKGTITIVR